MYASYYMCRYNFRFATPGMVEEFHFNKFQITSILASADYAHAAIQALAPGGVFVCVHQGSQKTRVLTALEAAGLAVVRVLPAFHAD